GHGVFAMRNLAAFGYVCLALLLGSPAAAQTASSPQADSRISASSADAVLADGTPVRLRTTRTISSRDARAGDPVNLEVLDEVKIDDTVVINKGGAGLAIVTVAEPKKLMGRGGKLDVSIDSATLVNGQKVALRAVLPSTGSENQRSIVSAISASNVSSAPLIFVRGKDITIPQGTEFVAYMNGDLPLDLASLDPATLGAKNAAATLAHSASELSISSFPDLAEIQIDGKFIGTTPCDVVVRSGEHKIDVRLSGFKIWHRTVTTSGNKLAFKIRLEQDGLNGSTVSNCSDADCSDIPLGDIARQKRAMERTGGSPQ
ncbi:MAG: PEGA domain-containing protein, partial [Terriglobales bacterium]